MAEKTTTDTTDSESEGTTMSNFKLRMALLKIWVVKNASTLLKLAAILAVVALILCVTLIDSFSDWLFNTVGEKGAVTWEKIVGYFTGALSAVGAMILFIYKVKKISIDDVKSSKRSVKEAMVKYGYYFNKDGKLSRHKQSIAEKTDDEDDTDDKIGIDNVSADGGVIVGTIRATQELKTIMSAKATDGATVEEVAKSSGLSEGKSSSAASDVEDSLLSDDAKEAIADKVDSISDSAAEVVGSAVENAPTPSGIEVSDEERADAGKATKKAVKGFFKDIWADVVYGWKKMTAKKTSDSSSATGENEIDASEIEALGDSASESKEDASKESAAASETNADEEPKAEEAKASEAAKPAAAEAPAPHIQASATVRSSAAKPDSVSEVKGPDGKTRPASINDLLKGIK
jgi:hypothetical protein